MQVSLLSLVHTALLQSLATKTHSMGPVLAKTVIDDLQTYVPATKQRILVCRC